MHMFDRNIYTYIYIYICVFTEQLFSWGVVLARLDCQGLSLFGCIHGEFWKHHGESSVSGHSSVRHPGKLPIFTLILSLTISRMECYCLDAMDSLQTTVSKPIATSVVYLINIYYIYILTKDHRFYILDQFESPSTVQSVRSTNNNQLDNIVDQWDQSVYSLWFGFQKAPGQCWLAPKKYIGDENFPISNYYSSRVQQEELHTVSGII